MKLEDKVATITGAAVGIGRATAEVFNKEGAKVIIADLDAEKGKKTAGEIGESNGEVKFVRVDVSQADQVQNMVDSTVKEFGSIDILVNNAGVYRKGDVATLDEKKWDLIMGVNLKAMFLTMKYTISQMRKQNRGTIVNVASEAGIVGIENQVAYNVSKAGVISLTKSSAIDLAKDNIRVNCVAPGTTETPLVEEALKKESQPEKARRELEKIRPLNRLGKPEEIAQAILYLASDSSAYATGSVLSIDGGYTAQ